jgi:hypothetical protein
MDWIDLAQDKGQVAGCCEYGNESLGFLKCRELQDLVGICLLTHIVHISSHRSRGGEKQNKYGVTKTEITSTARWKS